jgi:hypothetical protein
VPGAAFHDYDLSLLWRVEDLAIQKFVAQTNSLLATIRLVLSATLSLYQTRTATHLSLAAIRSALYLLLGILLLLHANDFILIRMAAVADSFEWGPGCFADAEGIAAVDLEY